MQNKVSQERLDVYRGRMSEWMSKQGVLFQLRHASSIGRVSILRYFGSLLLGLMILAFLAAAVGFFLLTRHFKSESYAERLATDLVAEVGGQDLEYESVRKAKGNVAIKNLSIEGGEDSFFTRVVLRKLKAPIGYLGGVTEPWSPSEVRIESASVTVKAGGTVEGMSKAFAKIKESLRGGDFQSLRIDELTMDWGYSKLTYGSIRGTEMQAERVPEGWKVSIAGGQFRQNWLTGFEIESGDFLVQGEGITVRSLKLVGNDGRLDLEGEVSGPIDSPQFRLDGKMSSIAIGNLIELPSVMIADYLSGNLSGSIQVSGSPNRQVEIAGEVRLGNGNNLTLRESFPILRALSLIDVNRSFRRVEFDRGGFRFKTSGGEVEVKEIEIESDGMVKIRGGFRTSLPSQEEAAETLGILLTEGFSSGFGIDFTDKSSAQILEDRRMSLGRQERIDSGEEGLVGEVFGEDDDSSEAVATSGDEIEQSLIEQEMLVHRFNGDLELEIPADTFAESMDLAEEFPETEGRQRVLKVPLSSIFTKLSETLADRLLALDRRKRPEESN